MCSHNFYYIWSQSTYKINPQRTFGQQCSFTLVSVQKGTLMVKYSGGHLEFMHDGTSKLKHNAGNEFLVPNLVRKVVSYIFLGQKMKKLYSHYGSLRPFWKTWITKITQGWHLHTLRNLQTGGLGSSILQRKNYILQVQVYHHGCRTISPGVKCDLNKNRACVYRRQILSLKSVPALKELIHTSRSLNPYPATFNNLNFHQLEVVSRYRDPQRQVGENYCYLFNLFNKLQIKINILVVCTIIRGYNYHDFNFVLFIRKMTSRGEWYPHSPWICPCFDLKG